jgi:hypothetical protein
MAAGWIAVVAPIGIFLWPLALRSITAATDDGRIVVEENYYQASLASNQAHSSLAGNRLA